MSDAVDRKTLFRSFRDPVSSGTNEEGALRLLSRFSYPELVKEIRDELVEYYSYRKFSLLHYACKNGWYGVSRKLVEKYQCDVHLEKQWLLYTPLHCACNWRGNIDIVKFLVVEQHCDPACCAGEEGVTPLHCACMSGKLDIVRFLIVEQHCDPACRGRWGSTPLHFACDSGKLDIVKFLVEECHCDPTVENHHGNTPLHLCCLGNGSIDIVRFLIVDQYCDPACRGWWGRTPLHWACVSGKLDILRFLVEECHCDPFRGKDIWDCTPLHLASREDQFDVLIFLMSRIPPLKLVDSVMQCSPMHAQLFQTFRKCRTEYPLEAFKIFVLGNYAAGKSTLVKVIENEITSFFGSFAGQWRNISKYDVEPLTAGIVPVSVESRRLGQIVIYDMAGHYQYYTSHAALLRNLVSSSASMFLVVVNLNQSREGIVRQLQYWSSFLTNCCTSARAGKPLTVAVFSHADEVAEEKPDERSSDAVKGLAHSNASSSFSEVVTLDCRKLASGGLTKISRILAGCCTKFKQTLQVDLSVHFLYAFISSRLTGESACTVSELQSIIKQEQCEDSFAFKIDGRQFLPTNTTELSQHLAMLSDKGQFLFLRNTRKAEDSWVIIDKAVLLSEVSGTVFAPDNFKQHHDIANSTGVVPYSKVREVFPKRDPDLVVAFLQHLEFCQEISESEVSLITTRHFRCSCHPVERFLFFPALVSEERPSEGIAAIETPSYRCGWILQCSQSHQFLTPQFLHVLLLRLAFSFALAPDKPHEVQTSPVLERRCRVWKNGICWLNRKGVETTVQVTEQNTIVFLTISCLKSREMECVKHRSQVIKCILEVKEELCSAVTMNESLIHPGFLTQPTSTPSLRIQLYSLSELAEAFLEREFVLVSQPGKTMIEVEELLHYEPYTCFSVEMLRVLFAEENSKEIVSGTFMDVVNKSAHTKVDKLREVVSIDTAQLQQDQPEYQYKQVFQLWKESPTYGSLRSALDKYSVFCGRNPLELAGCLPEATVAVVPSEHPVSDTHKCGNPTLIELMRFRGRERRINVPQEVSTKYTQFGILLLEDTNGDRVRNMEHKHKEDPEQINIEILQDWVSGRGKQPVSWATLTEVLRDVELCVLATEIEDVKLQAR